MARTCTCAAELVGNTPMLELARIRETLGLGARILAKLEYLNPFGSVKDRAALMMLEDAAARGLVQPGTVIIEPTSGNMGISLAALAAARGLRCVIVMPDSMSPERQRLLRALGAELVLTEGALGMAGAIRRAEELADKIPLSFMPRQFENPANSRAHYDTTGPEIWADAGGAADVFVCGVGSGGTVTGAGGYLKRRNPSLRVAAVEPAASPVLSGGRAGAHPLQGLGAGFVPPVLESGVYDEVIPVTGEEAFAAARLLARREGLMCGISSGAALHGAILLAGRPENAGRTIVTLFPDGGERYLSTPLFEP